MKDIPVIGLLLTELMFSYLYYYGNLSPINMEVIRFVPQSIFIIWLLYDRIKGIKGFKTEIVLRKALIYSVCMLYSLIILLNLYYAGSQNYYSFRVNVTNQGVITLGWFVVYIFLLFIATEKWIKKLLNR